MPDRRARYFSLALGLTAVFLGFFLWVNSAYLFHAKLYENADQGANSLSVLRAARFHELYGAYSRWNFYHPGPALFYSFALAEAVLYRTFHLVPTPFNAQVIMTMILGFSFLAAGISVAARWVRSGLFVPLALLLAVLHFTAMQPQRGFSTPWTAYIVLPPFFAMLMAAASVGAGQGDDLPLLVLAAGFAVHLHIAQPFFVGPMVVLAYAGLTYSCHRRSATAIAMGSTREASGPRRFFPRAHWFAAVLGAVFALPMIVDLAEGPNSNFTRILQHVRSYHGQRHPWMDSLSCFVRFGIYKPSSGASAGPEQVTPGQLIHYVLAHPEMTSVWLCALAAPIVALIVRRQMPVEGLRLLRWRFLGWLTALWLVVVGLTIVWGHIQDGPMFYYNSWFTYAIYYALALLAAGSLCDIAENLGRRLRYPQMLVASVAVLCALATIDLVSRQLVTYRERYFDEEMSRGIAHAVNTALSAHPDAPRTKLLVFSHDCWPAVTGIATRLSREGYSFLVPSDWWCMFGRDHVTANLSSALIPTNDGPPSTEIWRIVPPADVDPAVTVCYPLDPVSVLVPDVPALDPAAKDFAITFVGERPNSRFYTISGWAEPDPKVDAVWSVGKSAILNFDPKPVPVNSTVEVGFYFLQAFLPAGKHSVQRLAIRFNGYDIGTVHADEQSQSPLKISIPSAVWNERKSALLAITFPDASSPKELGESTDDRLLAFATVKLTFHTIDTSPIAASP